MWSLFLSAKIYETQNYIFTNLKSSLKWKWSYHRRCKIKTRRIALKKISSHNISMEELKDLAKSWNFFQTIKRFRYFVKTMSDEDFTFAVRQTSEQILDKKKDTINPFFKNARWWKFIKKNGDLYIKNNERFKYK